MNKFIQIILSIPKTIIFNFKALPLRKAVKLPIFIAYDADTHIHGNLIIEGNVTPAMIRVGFLRPLACDSKEQTRLYVEKGGRLILKGEAHIGHGARIIVRKQGEMILGENFAISANTTIQCYKRIRFGRDIQFAWDCLVMDSDTHNIISEGGHICNKPKEIVFGDKIWIGCRTTILKGASIPSNCVIGACSFVSGGKEFEKDHVIAGSPAQSVKRIKTWEL